MKRLAGLLAAAATFAAGVVVATSAAAPAAADPIGDCTTSSGVLVVVDFRHFGGPVARGCDASITTGYDALHDAGFTTQPTAHDGAGFVCRIDDQPEKMPGDCVYTPPANAYWSYWHADAGQSGWTYSSQGAQSAHPNPGSIDAWVFGATDIGGTRGGPTFTPAQVRAGTAGAPPPAPPKSHRPHSSTAARAPDRHRSSTPQAGDPVNAAPPKAGSSRGSSVSASSRAARAPAPVTGASISLGTVPASASAPEPAPTIVDASSVADKTKRSSGSVLPVVIGLALVLLLGGGAGWTVLRRRRAESMDG